MEDPTLAYEDMLFFERRLTEVISGMQPKVRKWKAIFLVVILTTTYCAYFWVTDPALKIVSFQESLIRHPMFTTSISILIILFLLFGVHKRVVAPKIITTRCRTALSDFCLSCDEQGKLIVRPAYSPAVSPINITPTKHIQPPSISSASFEGSGLVVEEESLLMDSTDVRCGNLLRTF